MVVVLIYIVDGDQTTILPVKRTTFLAATDCADPLMKDKDKPKTVSVLAFGNEIIISSSMKGSMPFAYTVENSPAAKILVECQKTWVRGGGAEGTTHKNDAGCAEVWVTQLYYNTHTTALKDQNARIAAIVSSDGNPPVARYPCATGSKVSCER